MTKDDLKDGELLVRFVSKETYHRLVDKHFDTIFVERWTMPTEKGSRFEAASHSYVLRVVLELDGEFAGFHTGYEERPGVYYMQVSAVLPEFRGRGLYVRSLSMLIESLWAKGFHEITSLHHQTANEILIPKLKLGFIVKGLETLPSFGTLIRLSHYKHDETRELCKIRCGQRQP